MRLVSWNVEWFDRLFDDKGRVIATDAWSARYEVTKRRQAEAIAEVLRQLDPDAALIIEAPDSSHRRSGQAALEHFSEWAGLRQSRALIGFANHTRQEIALIYDPDVVTARHAPGESAEAPRFDREFGFDLDTDLRAERLVWSKPPLELDLETPLGPLHLIGVHAKSKNTNGADEDEALRLAILNRRKQLAQCIWLRRRIDDRIAGGRLIVAGDFNDGPGLDRFETLFGRSSVEIVLGEGDTALVEPHAVPPRIGAAAPTTARFWDDSGKRWLNALLDFAMVSPDLAPQASWRILHPFDDAEAAGDPALQSALLDASDHFPVVLDLAATDDHL
ncbi:endonuclease/exonuclease/phosphatase family protein [Jannaschia aquimarina]|uniref:Endonuclease/Exonuclease/phosphatase family protein n=1 Tax=Jannaschia aquimarina TaxID=935700 RepID=A0A0D1ECS9_9RHOB|nr:endonuclease/exonuclease/phosphatase family protein [Jannaschia aquimarina]KIT15534.1 Endonuclease/Exonuclease/phosphatase family protein [Jannaschia aquimarina]SNT34662.1 Endonuclease/Exonuclease/phosphatase family protein [Jannaschia aquimarina]